jgi:hypothetical protein
VEGEQARLGEGEGVGVDGDVQTLLRAAFFQNVLTHGDVCEYSHRDRYYRQRHGLKHESSRVGFE